MSLSHALNNNIKRSLYIQLNIDNLYKNILDKKKKKFFCDCDINSCYCVSYGMNYNKNTNNEFDNIILKKEFPKKITKNQSKKNYNYLFNQWT